MARKFKKTPFRKWLDFLAKNVVKADADYICEIQQANDCPVQLRPLDPNTQWIHIKSRSSNIVRWSLNNALCGCGQCHQWAHANPDEWGTWFAHKYPEREAIINELRRRPPFVWKEEHFRAIEEVLLTEAKNIGLDYMNCSTDFRMRLKRILEG